MEKKEYEAKCCMYDILVEVDRICRKNKINYTLSNGTLIGAIKYKGYIPWDDDIDVCFLRNDYEKFIECCKSELNDDYRIVNAENEMDNPNLYHKIKIKNTKYVEKISQNCNINQEIFLDILPYDVSPQNYYLGFIHQLKISFYRRMLSIKCKNNFFKNKNYLKRFINYLIYLISKMYKKEYLIRKLKKLMTKYNHTKSDYVINAFGPYSYKKERMKKEIFSQYIETIFETKKFFVIKDYDVYLRKMYGDYMNTLPPENERTSRHEIMLIDLGEYMIKNYIKEND